MISGYGVLITNDMRNDAAVMRHQPHGNSWEYVQQLLLSETQPRQYVFIRLTHLTG